MERLSASCSTSVGNSYGKSYSNKIECISVLCSPGFPKTAVISPNGFLDFAGQSEIVACTLSPSSAPFILFSEIKISAYILLLSGTTKPKFLFFCKTPTNCVFARSKTSTTSASYFLLFRFLNTYALTLSLCNPFPRFEFGIKISSS